MSSSEEFDNTTKDGLEDLSNFDKVEIAASRAVMTVIVTIIVVCAIGSAVWVLNLNDQFKMYETSVGRHIKSLTIRVDAIENALNGASVDVHHTAQDTWQKERFQCYGIHHGNSDACSGHGKCTKPDNCECDECHDGPQCKSNTFLKGKCVVGSGVVYSTACLLRQVRCMKKWGKF